MTASTDYARKYPMAAARVVIRSWREGGDYLNAWEVLADAIGTERASIAVQRVAGAGGIFPSVLRACDECGAEAGERCRVDCTGTPEPERHASLNDLEGPVLVPDRVYVAHDRFVCVECAGMTAKWTGYTTGGVRVTPVTADDRAAWSRLGLGPLTCDCGRLTDCRT